MNIEQWIPTKIYEYYSKGTKNILIDHYCQQNLPKAKYIATS